VSTPETANGPVFHRITAALAVPDVIMGGALLLFIVFKLPHLSLPFFWDESGVYGKIIFDLADRKLSMDPGYVDQWISRGHPLLYSNIIAAGCKLFGTTVTVAHACNFALAIALLGSMYFHLKKSFHAYVGLIACTTLMAMPLFFTQSAFILPEVSLALALWWTTWAFIHKRYIVYVLCGSVAVLIKEPAIIWIGALWACSFLFYRKQLLLNLIWLVPCLVFGIFLLIQKQKLGWYFFPYHAGGFDFTFASINTKLSTWVTFFFLREARFLWAIILIAGGLLANMRLSRKHASTRHQRLIYSAALIPLIAYVLFCFTTFYHERYFIPTLPVLCSALGIAVYYGIAQERQLAAITAAFVLVAAAIPFNSSHRFNYDLDMSYTRSIETSKKTIQYMVEHGMFQQDIVSVTMPLLYAVNDPRFGYLPAEAGNGIHSRPINANTQFVVHTEPGTMPENPDGFALDTLEHWNQWGIKTTFYKVLPKDTIQ
jgi:hypothetical protein